MFKIRPNRKARPIQLVMLVTLSVMYSGATIGKNTDTNSTKNTRAPLALSWFKTNDAALKALSSTPAECLANGDSAQVKLGRIAFNSPRLLGGHAARMGLSCASCHPAGRRSDGFFIDQISDQPGTADVTHSIFSSSGGDQVFSPIRIPDLADPKDLKIADRNSEKFHQQITGLIEVEFDGQPAPNQIFEALRVYLLNTNIRHCADPDLRTQKTLTNDWEIVHDGLELIESAIVNSDAQTLTFLIAAVRAQMEAIYRRFGIEPINDVDQAMVEISRELSGLTTLKSTERRLKELKTVRANANILFQKLADNEKTSAYNSIVLSNYLKKTPIPSSTSKVN